MFLIDLLYLGKGGAGPTPRGGCLQPWPKAGIGNNEWPMERMAK